MSAPITASTIANPGEIEHGEMSFLGINPGGFVALSMIVVILIMIWKGVPKAIGRALDKKIASIREQLDEAAKLRAEAEALRSEYQARTAAAQGEAEQILAHARAEAEVILGDAKARTEQLIQRRSQMAEDKIAAAERAAIAQVRASAADAATRAAAAIIAERLDPQSDSALIDRAISSLGQRIN